VLSLVLIAAIHAVNHALFNMLTPQGITISHYFGFKSLSNITAGFTLYLFFYGFGQIPIGFISDRAPRKTILAAGAMLNGLAIAAAGAFPTYRVFLISLAVAGLGAAAYHPVGAAYLSELFSEAKGTALGISGIGATFGLTLGPFLGGALCERIGWRNTFFSFSAAAILVSIIFFLAAKEPARETRAGRAAGKIGWSRPVIIFLCLAAAVFTFREFSGWGGYYILPIFLESYHRFSVRTAGLISGLQSVGGLFAQPLGGYFSDRVGRRRLMSVLLFFVFLIVIAMPFCGRSMIVPLVLLYSVAYTATVPIIDAMIADRTPPAIRGGVFGLFMAAGIGISAFSPLAQAGILDATGASFRGFVTCFSLLGTTALISFVILLMFKDAGK